MDVSELVTRTGQLAKRALHTLKHSDEIQMEHTVQKNTNMHSVHLGIRTHKYTSTGTLIRSLGVGGWGGQCVFLWDAQQAEEKVKVRGEVGLVKKNEGDTHMHT